MTEIAETRVRYGYRRIHVLLRREGWNVNAKRTYRLYKEMGLQLRHKPPKRRVKAKLRSFNGKFRAECLNQHWFMSLDDAVGKCEAWRRDYNEVRPHSAIGNKPAISLENWSAAHGPPLSAGAG